ncbi:MAG: hypothetical protein J6Q72_03380 [Clostridia bacterium]|nr:hypothetical protein [Clostridia bacterium]
MKNLKNKAIITLLLVCMLVSVLLTGCSKKALTPEEIQESLVIEYQSDVDYYPDDYAVMHDSLREEFDDKLETIPAEGSYSFDGKEYILTHDTEKRLKVYEKGYFTFYRGKAEDGQTLEIEIAEVCDYPTRLILGCDCNEHFEYVSGLKKKEYDIPEHEMDNHVEAELQKMLDKENAGIDLSEYKRSHFSFYLEYELGSPFDTVVQRILVFHCKNCKKLVGYQIDGFLRLEELPDIPYTTWRALKTAVATVVDDYNENVYHKYPVDTTEETVKYDYNVATHYGYLRYSAEFDRYCILYTAAWSGTRKIPNDEIPFEAFTVRFAYLLEPKSNTGVIIAVSAVAVLALASVVSIFAAKRKKKTNEKSEQEQQAQQE